MSKKKKKIAIGLFVFFLAVASIVITAQVIQSKEKIEEKNLSVETKIVEFSNLDGEVRISGFLRGESRAEVAPLASGRISQIFKREGEFVKQGEVVAILDSPQMEAGVSSATSSVEALKKVISDSEKYYDQIVDQAEAAEKEANGSKTMKEAVKSAKRARDLQIESAKSQLAQAEGALLISQAGEGTLSVRAPFSGSIASIYGREGGFANFSIPLFSIVSPQAFELEAYVASSDARNISVDSVANLFLESGAPFVGIVTAVSPGTNSQNLKTLVRISIEDKADMLRIGDFLHGGIIFKRSEEFLSVPREAVVVRGGDSIIFTLDENNIIHENLVSIGDENKGQVEIFSGLESGQQVVVRGQQFVVNGIKVQKYE